ncbi:hypothetical protein HG530_006016 [Fusarium avenaceum]|nr:hypothetical protein HG530_006016 [Fusarium avenaceum]
MRINQPPIECTFSYLLTRDVLDVGVKDINDLAFCEAFAICATCLDHLLEHHIGESFFIVVVFLALELILNLLEVIVDQLFAVGTLTFAVIVVTGNTSKKYVNHVDVLLIGDGLLLLFRRHAATTRLSVVLLFHGCVFLIKTGSGICSTEEGLGILQRLFVVHLDVIVLNGDDTLSQEVVSLNNHVRANLLHTVDLGNGFGKTNHTLELTHSDSVRVLANASLGIICTEFLVLLHENILGLFSELGSEGFCKADVSLELLSAELRLDSLITQLMDSNNVFCQVAIDLLVALVEDDEEEIETRHNRCRHVDVGAESCLAVVATTNRVSSSKNTCSGVKSGLDASLCDRDGLLFHGFVDGNLICNIHLVKLINGTNTIVCQHKSTSLDGELACLLILDYCRSKTSSRRGLTTGVDSTGCKRTDILQELGLGGRRVTNNANVDVASKLHSLGGTLVNTRHELKKQTLLDDLMAINHGSNGLHKARVDVITVNHCSEVLNLRWVHGRQDSSLGILHRLVSVVGRILRQCIDNIGGTASSRLATCRGIWVHHAGKESKTICQVTDT